MWMFIRLIIVVYGCLNIIVRVSSPFFFCLSCKLLDYWILKDLNYLLHVDVYIYPGD